ncbi:MAG: hypothetical protein GY953_20940 [bacterium]|nr:hypothetical protein [bacterium]
MTSPDNTPATTLERAAAIGRDAGLHYVYAGNLPGRLQGLEDTCCHACGNRLVRRVGFRVQENGIGAGGRCPACDTSIPGRW